MLLLITAFLRLALEITDVETKDELADEEARSAACVGWVEADAAQEGVTQCVSQARRASRAAPIVPLAESIEEARRCLRGACRYAAQPQANGVASSRRQRHHRSRPLVLRTKSI